MQNLFIKNFLSAVLFSIVLFLLGYLVGNQIYTHFSSQVIEKQSNFVTSVESIATASVLKVTEICEYKYDESVKRNDGIHYILGGITNALFQKKLVIKVPCIARYGIDLQKDSIYISEKEESLHIKLPKPKLLTFELVWSEKKGFSEKGFFTFENNMEFQKVEKLLHQAEYQKFANYQKYLKQSDQLVQKKMIDFYQKLGKKIIFE